MSSDADTVQKENRGSLNLTLPRFFTSASAFFENGTKWPIIPLENGTNVLVLFRRYRDYVVSQSFKGNREMD